MPAKFKRDNELSRKSRKTVYRSQSGDYLLMQEGLTEAERRQPRSKQKLRRWYIKKDLLQPPVKRSGTKMTDEEAIAWASSTLYPSRLKILGII